MSAVILFCNEKEKVCQIKKNQPFYYSCSATNEEKLAPVKTLTIENLIPFTKLNNQKLFVQFKFHLPFFTFSVI